jgi:hypothetical protein
MRKELLLLLFIVSFSTLTAFSQSDFTKFNIPSIDKGSTKTKSLNDCESCNAALDPALRKRTVFYKQSNLRDWLYQYFKSDESQRQSMKNSASSDANLSAVVKSVPVKFGYKSNKSKEYNYWNKKYVEWSNTRLISIDDIAYLFKADSKDQLQAWLECKKTSCTFSAANYAEKSIFLDVQKIRNGRYNISLTNLSIANIKITDIQVDDVLEKVSGNNFRVNKKVSNKGGIVTATYSSKSTIDVDFAINLTYEILGTNDEGNTRVVYRIKPELPDAPIGTIIATTLTYNQFLKVNQIQDLSSSEQVWLPCDGRSIPNGNYITKTPDLRGLFIRGANIMDVNEGLHTNPVSNNQRNPENINIGVFQQQQIVSHNHTLDSKHNGFSKSGEVRSHGTNGGGEYGFSQPTSSYGGNETRPKNISVLYLIRVR